MKRNIRIASLTMLMSLLGLLSFQAYWISSAYNQKKTALEAEIREAFSKANNGLLIKKLGNLSGMEISVSAEGSFFSSDTILIKEHLPFNRHRVDDRAVSRTITIGAGAEALRTGTIVDTVISEIQGALNLVGEELDRSVFMARGEISQNDLEFMDSLLRFYLSPIHLENHYVLSYGLVGSEEYEFSGGMHALPISGKKVKSLIQPLSFGMQEKMAKLEYSEGQIVRSSLSGISLIIFASVVMLMLLISAWYYIVRSLQRQYQLTQMKDDFISNMTHELKTPVTASSLALEVIAKNDKVSTDANLTDLIGVARSEQDRMLSMIDTILESTTHNGLNEEHFELLHLNEELEAVSETIRLKVSELGGTMALDITSLELVVKGSQVHLQNAIINILENAVKYSQQLPELKVSLQKEGKMAALTVTDNGVGISKEDQKRIFEKFFRVSTGNVHTVKGYGLGLSYTQAVIRSFDGSIEVESEPGKGTTFTIKLPIANES